MTEGSAEVHPLHVEGMDLSYGPTPILRDVCLSVPAGHLTAALGPSGSGKSSLLRCVVGLQKPDAGDIVVAGVAMTTLDRHGRAVVRRQLIGSTTQEPGLLPELDVRDNVAITLLFDGVTRERGRSLADRALESVGLEGHGSKRIDQVSGGQAQRIALARALVRPTMQLLVADEPTANLDRHTATEMARLLRSVIDERRVGALVATHDERVADVCDSVIDLASGPQGP